MNVTPAARALFLGRGKSVFDPTERIFFLSEPQLFGCAVAVGADVPFVQREDVVPRWFGRGVWRRNIIRNRVSANWSKRFWGQRRRLQSGQILTRPLLVGQQPDFSANPDGDQRLAVQAGRHSTANGMIAAQLDRSAQGLIVQQIIE